MFESRLTKIDRKLRESHPDILEHHHCYFLMEYAPKEQYIQSNENMLLFNFKMIRGGQNTLGGHFKRRAIREVSKMFSKTLDLERLKQCTLVPMPGSKIKGHRDYDDRMERVCRGICPGLDVRTLVKQRADTPAFHSDPKNRLEFEKFVGLLDIDKDLLNPMPKSICVFDDVVNGGTHFMAIHYILSNQFPGTDIKGFFIFRTLN